MVLEKPVIAQSQGMWLALDKGEVLVIGDSFEDVLREALSNSS